MWFNLEGQLAGFRLVAAVLLASILFPCWGHAQSLAERAEYGEFQALLSQAQHDQMLATLHVFFGRFDLNLDLSGLHQASRNCPEEAARETSGREWVLATAQDAKVLMFNENHYGVVERVFVRKLLDDLRELGFTHIGFEAFRHDAANKNGRYTPATDIYTREPAFAALIRKAEELGFELFGHEPAIEQSDELDPVERFERRESGQAALIQARIEAAPEDARFVIFAGWSHIAKVPVPAPGGVNKWMAARFKDNTGIDPLVVDLTSCADESPDPGDWDGRILLDTDGEPMVFGRDAQAFDAQIRLPVPPSDHPQAAGFYRHSLGQPVAVPEALRLDDEPVLVQARNLSAPSDAAAHDRLLLHPGEDFPLYLQAGEFELQSHRGDGSVIGSLRIEVE